MLASAIFRMEIGGKRRLVCPKAKRTDAVNGGTEYTVTGSYEGTEPLDKKLKRIMEQNAANAENGITEDADE
jgi:hypothetical protein